MRRKGQEVRSRTDYILGTDRRLFRNVTVRDPRHNSDHYMVLGCSPSAPLSETKQYLVGQNQWPVRPPTQPSRSDELFADLRRAVPRPKTWEARRNDWISAETWRLIEECLRPGPLEQLGPLHGPWLLAERTPVGDKAITGGTKALAGEATDKTITDGRTLCGSTESRTKAETAGGETKRLDLGGDVGAH